MKLSPLQVSFPKTLGKATSNTILFDSSPMPTEEDMAQLDIWKADESFYETIMAYLRLDEYGKYAVESVIKAEVARCRECDSLFPEENFKIVLRIKNS